MILRAPLWILESTSNSPSILPVINVSGDSSSMECSSDSQFSQDAQRFSGSTEHSSVSDSSSNSKKNEVNSGISIVKGSSDFKKRKPGRHAGLPYVTIRPSS